MKENMTSLKTHPTSTTISRLTSIIMFYMSGLKSVKGILHYLSNAWTLVIGFPMALVLRMSSYFPSTRLELWTLSSEGASQWTPKITPNFDYMLWVRIQSLKKSFQKLKKSNTQSISLAWTVSALMEPPLTSYLTGPTTSSSPKLKRRGQALESFFQESIASSVEQKRSAGRAVTSTTK